MVNLMVFPVILPLEALHCLDFTALGAPLRRRTDVRSLKSFLPGPMSCFGGVDPRDTDEMRPTKPHPGALVARLLAPALSPDWNLTEAERWRLRVRDQGHMFVLQVERHLFSQACHLIREIMRIHC